MAQGIEQCGEEKNKKMFYLIPICENHGSKVEFSQETWVTLPVFPMNFIRRGMNLRTKIYQLSHPLRRMKKVRVFQRKLYRKARQEKNFKVYSLYEKISVLCGMPDLRKRWKKSGGSAFLIARRQNSH